jgi:hypothetical protein
MRDQTNVPDVSISSACLQYNEENGITPPVREPRAPREPREPREPRAEGRGRGRGRGRGAPTEGGEEVNESSGLQIVVNGLPWAWTWKELKELVEGTGNIVRVDVVYGRDGRRCVLPTGPVHNPS